jgi:hypothetical protein
VNCETFAEAKLPVVRPEIEPVNVGVKVWVLPLPTIVKPTVRPLSVTAELVASVWVGPVWVWLSGPRPVMAAVR